MITTKLMGGLGNMLFQIAAGYAVAKRSDQEYLLNTAYTEIGHGHSRPQSPDKYLGDVFSRLNILNDNREVTRIVEPSFSYNLIENQTTDCSLEGYYQSYKYFEDCENDIRDLFAPKDELIQKIHTQYKVKGEETVAVHIRRGDYLPLANFHHNLHISYYTNAIKLFPTGTTFIIISDDIEWCKEVFVGNKYVFTASHSDVEDLYTMSECSHNIIANSTFSWWGAWLNSNINKLVIYPNKWFGPGNNHMSTLDLFPPSWVCVNE